MMNTFAVAVLAAFAVARPMAQLAIDLQRLDGFPIDIPEALFTKSRPEALLLLGGNRDGRNGYFYQPEKLSLFGLPVATVGRGFESGRGCAVYFTFANPTVEQPSDLIKSTLIKSMTAALGVPVHQRQDSSGNQWWFFESQKLFASAIVFSRERSGQTSPVTFGVSSRLCDPSVAAAQWQTRPR